MRFNSLILGTFVAVTLISGCATGPQKLQTDDKRACAQNFTTEGSLLAGRIFKTNQLISGVSKKIAMEKASKHIAKGGGLMITNIDKESGVINASVTNSSLGNVRSTPFTMVFDQNGSGVDVSLSLSVSGGQLTSPESVKNDFCDILAAISKK